MIKRGSVYAYALLVMASTANAHTSDDQYNEVTIRPSDVPSDAPRFESYPALVYKGQNTSLKLGVDSRNHLFRTRLKEWSREKANFAGHYILATWGCGTDCVQMTIIDAKTGKIFYPRGVASNSAVNVHAALLDGKPNWPNGGSIKYKVSSELLVLIGMPEEDTGRRGISYYVWHYNRLRLIRFIPKAWYR